MGQVGSGKSTLISAILGELHKEAGHVSVKVIILSILHSVVDVGVSVDTE